MKAYNYPKPIYPISVFYHNSALNSFYGITAVYRIDGYLLYSKHIGLESIEG